MRSSSNLPPELQEVETELQAALEIGGLDVVREFVDRLASEAEFGKILADEADLAVLKIEEDAETFPEIKKSAEVKIGELTQTSLAGRVAVARYHYAAMRWKEIAKTIP